jgi:hypothetical protein
MLEDLTIYIFIGLLITTFGWAWIETSKKMAISQYLEIFRKANDKIANKKALKMLFFILIREFIIIVITV